MRARGAIVAVVVAAAAALALLALSAGSDSAGDDAADTSGAVADAYVEELCVVLGFAEEGDLVAARRRFDHEPLHDLAARLGTVDAPAAEALFVAKDAVEHGLARTVRSAEQVAADLRVLIDLTRTARTATGAPTPPPCA